MRLSAMLATLSVGQNRLRNVSFDFSMGDDVTWFVQTNLLLTRCFSFVWPDQKMLIFACLFVDHRPLLHNKSEYVW